MYLILWGPTYILLFKGVRYTSGNTLIFWPRLGAHRAARIPDRAHVAIRQGRFLFFGKHY
jgi:hypothetical protein